MLVRRVLMAHNRYRVRGGEERAVELLERSLQQRGIQTYTWSIDSDTVLREPRLMRARRFLQTPFSWDTYRVFQQVCHTIRPDVIHVHNVFPFITPSLYWAAQQMRIPVVQTIHNYRLFCANGLFYRHGRPCEDCLLSSTLHAVRHRCYQQSLWASAAMSCMYQLHRMLHTWTRTIDAYIALSEFGKRKLVEGGIAPQRIHVIPNFVDIPPERPIVSTPTSLLFMGRLSAEKGILRLLDEFEWFSARAPGVQLEICGDGPLRPQVEAYLSSHRQCQIRYHGYVFGNEKRKLLERSMGLVFPSLWYEGCPYVALESLAAGIPVIGPRLGAIPELFEEGQSGFLYDPNETHGLGKALLDLWERRADWPQMSMASRQWAIQYYNESSHMDRLLRVYEALGSDSLKV